MVPSLANRQPRAHHNFADTCEALGNSNDRVMILRATKDATNANSTNMNFTVEHVSPERPYSTVLHFLIDKDGSAE